MEWDADYKERSGIEFRMYCNRWMRGLAWWMTCFGTGLVAWASGLVDEFGEFGDAGLMVCKSIEGVAIDMNSREETWRDA
jgi:hypothetical protein